MGDCKGKEAGECCGGTCSQEQKEIDVSSLGPEAVELAEKFERVNENLVNALQVRKEILEMLHEKSTESSETKEKLEKVIKSRHPVLLQFVFGGHGQGGEAEA